MIKLKDKVIRICKLKVVNGRHVHDFRNSKLLDPSLVSFYSQQIAFCACLFLFLNCLYCIFVKYVLLKD